MSGNREIVTMLHSLSFNGTDAKDATKGPPPSVETLLAEGKTRLKEWEEKNNVKQSAGGGTGGVASSGDDSSIPCFTAGELELTAPAEPPEAEAESEEWKEKGNEAFKRKDYRTAIDAYTKAIILRGTTLPLDLSYHIFSIITLSPSCSISRYTLVICITNPLTHSFT